MSFSRFYAFGTKRTRCGFTLIELMITVAVLSVLATVAIPAYIQYIRRGRVSEAVTSIAAIKAAEEQYAGTTTTQCYLPTSAWPAAVPSGTPSAWGTPAAATGWDNTGLGVRPNRTVWFQYQVIAGPTAGAGAECGQNVALVDAAAVTGAVIRGADSSGGDMCGATLDALTLVGPGASWVDDNITSTWYIVVARGDQNADGDFSEIIGFIDESNIIMCDDLE